MPNSRNTQFKCLQAVLHDKDEAIISMENFSKMLAWFGPMESGEQILQAVEDLLKQPYFFGDMGAPEAEKLLASQKELKTFLIRFSARDPGCYAISTVAENKKVKHFRVYHKPGLKFLIGKTEVDSLKEIVKKYGDELELKYPCPGWPYQSIFVKTKEATKVEISEGYQVPDFP